MMKDLFYLFLFELRKIKFKINLYTSYTQNVVCFFILNIFNFVETNEEKAEKSKWLARQAHNLKVVGSSPTSAQNFSLMMVYCLFLYSTLFLNKVHKLR